MNMSPDYKPSEGEEFLEDFLYSIGIEFESQKRIEDLKYDSKQFRTADFYLPKYKVYIEFFGLWNNSGNDEYKQKKDVYQKNNIPCIYIYPENLGIIEYTFDKRIQVVLGKNNLMKELHAYRIFKFKSAPEFKNRIAYLLVALFCIITILLPIRLNSTGYFALTGLSFIVVYQVYQLFQLYLDIFKRNKFSLDNLY